MSWCPIMLDCFPESWFIEIFPWVWHWTEKYFYGCGFLRMEIMMRLVEGVHLDSLWLRLFIVVWMHHFYMVNRQPLLVEKVNTRKGGQEVHLNQEETRQKEKSGVGWEERTEQPKSLNLICYYILPTNTEDDCYCDVFLSQLSLCMM